MRPHPQQIIKAMNDAALTLDSFGDLHPEVSRQQIATITGCTIDAVNSWFSGRRNPTKGAMALLWIYHLRAIAPEGVSDILSA